jgi:hypothetical protein
LVNLGFENSNKGMKYTSYDIEMTNNQWEKVMPTCITNRLLIFQSDEIYNKLGNKLQSLNIQTCESNITSKTKA